MDSSLIDKITDDATRKAVQALWSSNEELKTSTNEKIKGLVGEIDSVRSDLMALIGRLADLGPPT